jgi:hypothetical protein
MGLINRCSIEDKILSVSHFLCPIDPVTVCHGRHTAWS